jgi:linearmycin/streptolysin S transport system ATP-binding protein
MRAVTPAVVVEALTRRYGARVALAGIDFTVAPGEIVGLLGPNGAGKSTTLSILATLLHADSGRVVLGGHELPAAAAAARRLLGLVPQREAFYPTLTARENLVFFGRMQGLSGTALGDAIDRGLDMVGLARRADEPVGMLSGGMRRRLNLACGILHRPRIMLLDEPTVGVDPQSREHLFDAIVGLARDGAAIVYSTHHMEEAERLCARVVLLDAGRVMASGTPAALVTDAGMLPRLELRTARSLPAGWLTGLPGVGATTADGLRHLVELHALAAAPAVIAAAAAAGGEVQTLALHRPSLADLFFALTGKALRDEPAEEAP